MGFDGVGNDPCSVTRYSQPDPVKPNISVLLDTVSKESVDIGTKDDIMPNYPNEPSGKRDSTIVSQVRASNLGMEGRQGTEPCESPIVVIQLVLLLLIPGRDFGAEDELRMQSTTGAQWWLPTSVIVEACPSMQTSQQRLWDRPSHGSRRRLMDSLSPPNYHFHSATNASKPEILSFGTIEAMLLGFHAEVGVQSCKHHRVSSGSLRIPLPLGSLGPLMSARAISAEIFITIPANLGPQQRNINGTRAPDRP
ncbi:hypothetical protein BJ170DRAFT_598270 [Xylariales sp. AK1849]|nr:hypothetical protein BJ170DRAFT_598270 [Xylariales sp. AK1849]